MANGWFKHFSWMNDGTYEAKHHLGGSISESGAVGFAIGEKCVLILANQDSHIGVASIEGLHHQASRIASPLFQGERVLGIVWQSSVADR